MLKLWCSEELHTTMNAPCQRSQSSNHNSDVNHVANFLQQIYAKKTIDLVFSPFFNTRNGYTTVNQLERMTWRTFSISILSSFSTSTLHRTVRLGHVLKCITTNNNAAAWLFPSSYMWYWSWRTPEHWLQSAMIRYSMNAHTEVSNLPRILVMASECTLLLGSKSIAGFQMVINCVFTAALSAKKNQLEEKGLDSESNWKYVLLTWWSHPSVKSATPAYASWGITVTIQSMSSAE